MKRGFLSEYFEGVAVKRLSVVETDPKRSHQHEFNGTAPLKRLLGLTSVRNRPARFLWLGGENEGITDDAPVSWYDSRENQPRRSPEWRLYFKANSIMELARPSDLLIVARRPDGELFLIVVAENTTLENQLAWLFGLGDEIGAQFQFEEFAAERDRELDFASRYILDELGIEPEEPDAEWLDTLLERFGRGFPTTAVFSAFARDTLPDVSPVDEPDATLLAWLEHEEKLFRRLERHMVADRLGKGFTTEDGADVDGFLSFSLSVQNRRKSRMGYVLENHLEEIFRAHSISYNRGARTENQAKPDFLFPGADEYHDITFPESRLTMLGSKSTCKDRWRQVLTEAKRIDTKHLLTLEPGISENQTDEMKAHRLQLVLPTGLHDTYKPVQQDWLMDMQDFLGLVGKRQVDF